MNFRASRSAFFAVAIFCFLFSRGGGTAQAEDIPAAAGNSTVAPPPNPGLFFPLAEDPELGPVWRSHHAADNVTVLFSQHGTAFHSGGVSSVLQVAEFGRTGGAKRDPGAVTGLTAEGIEGNVWRTGVSERLENLPDGLKQTFIVHEKPGTTGGDLAVSIRVLGGLRVAGVEPEAVRFSGEGGKTVIYDTLLVYDATGRQLPARFVASGESGMFGIEVDDRDAVYPVEIDPVFRPMRPLGMFGEVTSDRMILEERGTVIRIDRDLCLVGVPGYNLVQRSRDDMSDAAFNFADELSGGVAGGSGYSDLTFQMVTLGLALLNWLEGGLIEEVGAVFVFRFRDGAWQYEDVLNDWSHAARMLRGETSQANLEGGRFGESIALSNSSIMIGAPGIQTMAWVNYLAGYTQINGPNVTGGVYFFQRPANDGPFFAPVAFRKIDSELGTISSVTGLGGTRYTEVGRMVGVGTNYAVAVSGGGFDPMQFLAIEDGYGPCKLHHFRRSGNSWVKLADVTTDVDFKGRVIDIAILGEEVFLLEEDDSFVHLHRYTAPTSSAPTTIDLLASWENAGAAKLSARGESVVVGLPGLNQFALVEQLTPGSWNITEIGARPGETHTGEHVAHGDGLIVVSARASNETRIHLWQRGDNNWTLAGSETLEGLHPLRGLAADANTVAAMGPAPGNSAHSEVRLMTYNRQIRGTAYFPDGTPAGNQHLQLFRHGLEIPAHAAGLSDGARIVPVFDPPWTLNTTEGASLRFWVPDHIRFLDDFELELELEDIPSDMTGRTLVVMAELPLQKWTWYGNERFERPGLGTARIPFRNGTAKQSLWFGGGFHFFANQNNVTTAGEWNLRLFLTGTNRGTMSYGRIKSARLILKQADGGSDYVLTGSDGSFEFADLPPGRFSVGPFHDRYRGSTGDIRLQTQAVVEGARLDFVGNLSLRGVLRTESDNPIAGAVVTLGGVSSVTDENGGFFLDGLSPGMQMLRVEGDWLNHLGTPIEREVDPSFTEFLTVRAYPTAAPFAVPVVSATGQPLANVQVRVTGPFGYDRLLTTDADGVLHLTGWNELYPGLYPGDYRILGVSSAYDWPVGGIAISYPVDGDIPPFGAIGSTLAVDVSEVGIQRPGQPVLITRSTGGSNLTLAQATPGSAVMIDYRGEKEVEVGTLTFTGQEFDTIRSLRFYHRDTAHNSVYDNAPFTYVLIGPDGDELVFDSAQETLVGFDHVYTRTDTSHAWAGRRAPGEYRLVVRFPNYVVWQPVWSAWRLELNIRRHNVDRREVAVTDSTGIARFYDLPGGNYFILPATRLGGGTTAAEHQELARAQPKLWRYSRELVSIPVGSDSEAEIELTRMNRISGDVRVRGNALAGVEIRAIDGDTNTILRRTVTPLDGSFALEQIPSGNVRLEAIRSGFTLETETGEWAPLTGDVSGVLFVAGANTKIGGTVVDAAGIPVSGVGVILRPVNGVFHGNTGTYVQSAWTEFELEVDSNALIQDLTLRLFTSYANEEVHLIHPDGTLVRIERHNNETLGNRMFNDRFPPMLLDTFYTGNTEFAPVDPFSRLHGKPAGGTWTLRLYGLWSGTHTVHDWSLEIEPMRPAEQRFERHMLTDENGEYLFAGLAPGFYEIILDSDLWWFSGNNWSVDTSTTNESNFAATAVYPEIEVVVTDDGGVPVAGATVWAAAEGKTFQASTGGDGVAVVEIPSRTAGTVRVVAGEAWFTEPETAPFDTTAGEPVSLTFVRHPRMDPGVTIASPNYQYPATLTHADFAPQASVTGEFTFGVADGSPLTPGVLEVGWEFVPDDLRRFFATSGSVDVSVTRGEAEIIPGDLAQVYDGTPREVSFVTVPPGLPVSVTYPGGSAPVMPGVYPVELVVDTPTYFGTASAELTVGRATVQIGFPEAVDGVIRRIVGEHGASFEVTVDPSGFSPTLTFESAPGTASYGPTSVPPDQVGNYRLTATVDAETHAGTATVDYQVLPEEVEVYFPEAVDGVVHRVFSGAAQPAVTAATTPSGVEVNVVYSGTGNDGLSFGPSGNPPVNAGTYTVTATVVGEAITGSATVELEIARAPANLIEVQPTTGIQAGDLIDLDDYFSSNGGEIAWKIEPGNLNAVWLSDVVTWGGAATNGAPARALDLIVNGWGGIALVPGGKAVGWEVYNGRVFEWENIGAIGHGNLDFGPGAWVALEDGSEVRHFLINSSQSYVAYELPAEFAFNVKAIASGDRHCLVLSNDGRLAMVVGTGDTFGLAAIPAGLEEAEVIAIASGRNHVLALTVDGQVYAWGDNGNGQTGVPSLGQAAKGIGAGWDTSVAILSDGTAVSWGAMGGVSGTGAPFRAAEAGADFVLFLGEDGRVHGTGGGPAADVPAAAREGVDRVRAHWGAAAALKPTTQLEVRSAGTANLVATIPQTANVEAGEVEITFNVSQRQAWVMLDGFDSGVIQRTFNGIPVVAPVATTEPEGVAVAVRYSGEANDGTLYGPSDTPPTLAGTYTITAEVEDPRFEGSLVLPLMIGKAPVSLSFGNLETVFDGSPKVPTITTGPAGLAVNLWYDGQEEPPVEPGTYLVTAEVVDSNHTGSGDATLVIDRAPQSVSPDLPATALFGAGPIVLPTESSAGLPVSHEVISGPGTVTEGGLSLDGAGVIVLRSFSEATSRYYFAEYETTITVAPAEATVQIVQPSEALVYDGFGKSLEVVTDPPGLPVSVTYAGSPANPVNAGTYSVVATVNHPNYSGSATGTMTIRRAAPVFSWFNLEHVYDGEPKKVLVLTSPADLNLVLDYMASTIEPGNVTVFATASGPNHFGEESAVMIIDRAPQTIDFPELSDAVVDDEPIQLEAIASSALAVQYAVLSGPAWVSHSGVLTITGAGEVTVEARQAGNFFYHPATPVTRSFAVAKREVEIGVTLPPNLVYSGTLKEAVAFSTEPYRIAASQIQITYNGSSTPPVDAGTYEVVATAETANHTAHYSTIMVIERAEPGISIDPYYEYTGLPVDLRITVTPGSLPFTVDFPGFDGVPVDAGDFTARITVDSENHYGSREQAIEIRPVYASISVAANRLPYTGGDQLPEVITDPPGLNYNLTVNPHSPWGPPTTHLRHVGSYLVTIVIDDPNHLGERTLFVYVDPAEVVYHIDEGPLVFHGGSQRSFLTTEPANVPLQWTIERNGVPVADIVDAGEYVYSVSPTDPGFLGGTSGTVTIVPAPLEIEVTGLEGVYNGNAWMPQVTVSPAGIPVETILRRDGNVVEEAVDAGVYAVVVESSDSNYAGTFSGELVIAKASHTLSFLAPESLPVWETVSLDAVSSAGQPVGLRIVEGSGRLEGNQFTGTEIGTVVVEAYYEESLNFESAASILRQIVIEGEPATVTLAGLEQGFDGQPKTVEPTTDPAGLQVVVWYDGSETPPVNAGSYMVEAVVVEPGFSGRAEGVLVVSPATAEITVGPFAPIYDGTLQALPVVTVPEGLAFDITYWKNGTETAPVDAGSYMADVEILDTNHIGLASFPFTIGRAEPSIVFPEEEDGVVVRPETGEPVAPVEFAVTPEGLGTSIVYRRVFPDEGYESSEPPSEGGIYEVTVEASGPNHFGVATIDLVVGTNQVTFALAETEGNVVYRTFTGEPAAAPEVIVHPAGVPFTVTYNNDWDFSQIPPINAGAYEVKIESAHPSFTGEMDFFMVIAQKEIEVGFETLQVTYDGSPHRPVPVTEADVAMVTIAFAHSGGDPVEPGSYPFSAVIWDQNFTGSTEAVFVIDRIVQSVDPGLPETVKADVGTLELPEFSSVGLPVSYQVLSGPATLGSGGLTIHGMGEVRLRAFQAGDAHHHPAETVVVLTVEAPTITLVLPDIPPVYDGEAKGVQVVTNPPGLPVVVTYDGSSELPVNAGSYEVVAAVDHPDYEGEASGTLVILRAGVEFVWSGLTHVYDGVPKEAVVETVPAGLPVTLVYGGETVLPGQITLTATVDSLNHYGMGQAVMSIERASQTLDFPEIADGIFGDDPVELAATASSGLAVEYQVVAGPAVVEVGSRLRSTGAGQVTVRAIQPGDHRFLAAAPVEQTVEFAKREVQIGIMLPWNLVYDGGPKVANGSTTDAGRIHPNSIAITYDGSPDPPVNAGIYTVEATAENANYFGYATATMEITRAPVTFTASPFFDYTGEPIELAVTTNPAGLPYTVEFVGLDGPPTDAGEYEVRLIVDEPNYYGLREMLVWIDHIWVTLTLGPLRLNYTGENQLPVVTTDPPDVPLRYTFTPLYPERDPVPYLRDVGTYRMVVAVDNPNYWGSRTATVYVDPTEVIYTMDDSPLIYDGTPKLPGLTTEPANVPLQWQISRSGSTVAEAVAAGTYAFSVSSTDPGFQGSLSGNFVIQPAPLSVQITGLSHSYTGGAVTPTLTVDPEGVPVTVVLRRDGVVVAEAVDAGSYDVEVMSADSNYAGGATATLVIGKAIQTIQFNPPATIDLLRPVSLEATTYSGQSVEFRLLSGAATLDETTLTGTEPGTVVVEAVAPETGNFQAAAPVVREIEVVGQTAEVILENLLQVYDGGERPVTVATVPEGLAVTIHYNGSPAIPVDAGSYEVVATVAEPGFIGTTTGTLVIAPREAEISVAPFEPVFNQNIHTLPVATVPSGLAYEIVYTREGNPAEPRDAGTYQAEIEIVDPNHFGTRTVSFQILPAPAIVGFPELIEGIITRAATGSAVEPVTVTTEPAGLDVAVLYRGIFPDAEYLSSEPPTAAGHYRVEATVADANHIGSGEAELQVGDLIVVFDAPEAVDGRIIRVYNGTAADPVTVLVLPEGIEYSVTYFGISNGGVVHGPSPIPPVNAGTYQVAVRPVSDYYDGGLDLEFVIERAVREVALVSPENVSIGENFRLSDLAGGNDGALARVTLVEGPVRSSQFFSWGNWQAAGAALSLPGVLDHGVEHFDVSHHGNVAAMTGGWVFAWGNDWMGENNPPMHFGGAVRVAAAQYSRAAVNSAGFVAAWGWANQNQTSVPADIQGKVVDIAAGDYHYVALLDDGNARAWGSVTTVPADINARNLVAVAAGGSASGAVDDEGRVHVWGSGAPTPVPSAAQSNVTKLGLVFGGAMALRDDGVLVAWGAAPEVPSAIQGSVVDFAFHYDHGHAILTDGRLVSWGYDSALLNSPQELRVAGANVDAIAAGQHHVLVRAAGENATITGAGMIRVLVTIDATDNYLGFSYEYAFPVGGLLASIGPGDVVVTYGEPFTFTSSASGVPPYTYQWFRDGQPIPGAIAETLDLLSVDGGDEGTYTLSVADQHGETISAPVVLQVAPVARPDTVEGKAGEPVKFTVASLLANDSAAGDGSLSFQWLSPMSDRGGEVVRQGNWIFYFPPDDIGEPDTFYYEIVDGRGLTGFGQVTIVSAKKAPPPGRSLVSIRQDHDAGGMRVTFAGIPGAQYQIETSGNLVDWETVASTTAGPNGVYEYLDTETGVAMRFYRSRRVSGGSQHE